MMKQRLPMIFHKNIICSFIVETIAKIAIILHHREELEYFTNCSILSILFHEIRYEQVKYTLNPWLNIARYVTFVEMVSAKRMYNILRKYRDNYYRIYSFSPKKYFDFWQCLMFNMLILNWWLYITMFFFYNLINLKMQFGLTIII